MSSKIKVNGLKKGFIADWNIIDGLYKVTKRNSIRTNLKAYNIKPNKADSKGGMGIKFQRLKNVCLVHFDIPSARNMQLIVFSDMDVKAMKKVEGMNDTYIKLIKTAHDVACGKDVESKPSVFKKIKDAIF